MSKKLIKDDLRLVPFTDNGIKYLAKDKNRLKAYLNAQMEVYNKMIDYVNDCYKDREHLKDVLDKMYEKLTMSRFEGQDILIQAKAKKEMLNNIMLESGLYDGLDIYCEEIGEWKQVGTFQDNMDICEKCDESDTNIQQKCDKSTRDDDNGK